MQQTVDVLWICIYVNSHACEGVMLFVLHISREASAGLLVQLTGQCEGLQL